MALVSRPLVTRDDIEHATRIVYRHMAPTPQYVWPQICAKLGATVWVKHENHTPTGAFKIRGGITFIDWLTRTHPKTTGIITATRGNHGQSQARAATAAGLRTKIVVPHGNSPEKNDAMRAFGAEVVAIGQDFDEAKAEAARLACDESLYPVPSFHQQLVAGVSTYAMELFAAAPDLDTVYVPIGGGSGICGVIAARDALGLKTEVVGVVSTEAPAAKLSFDSGHRVETDSARTFVDGLAVRIPVDEALAVYQRGASRIVAVSDDEVAAAMRIYFHDTHNVAEGAGAAALAALLQEREVMRGRRVGVILCGGNVDTAVFADVLRGVTPVVD
ncbi:MAG: threonine dehydratase [Azospirillaceae bacterium]|nr:threonine dehydratase [Azospirillaceae bacterium]